MDLIEFSPSHCRDYTFLDHLQKRVLDLLPIPHEVR